MTSRLAKIIKIKFSSSLELIKNNHQSLLPCDKKMQTLKPTTKILHYFVTTVLKINLKKHKNKNQSIGMRVVLGNLRPRTNELNRCNALEGCAYGTI